MNIGIVGLPNAGKSTIFNALTRSRHARVANFPFSTVEPNRAIVPVPDPRLDRLHELLGVEEKIYATIEFLDIAGLVQGASQGEGLGNQFLGQIRNTDAILHVVRCFDDPNVARIGSEEGPEDDIEIVTLELILADLQQLERAVEKLSRQVKGDKKLIPVLELAQQMSSFLSGGSSLNNFEGRDSEAFQFLNKEMRFLTAKTVIFAANVDENRLNQDDPCTAAISRAAVERGGYFVKVGAFFEEELVDMPEVERQEFLALAGVRESALAQVIRTGYQALGLISFFTMNEREVRAWTIPRGWVAR
ncbi:MAG TPA: redox-regulated ATPase YchF, partial [Anaerolineales bacterium]|nr:redox-regulated ATPase YchF [Anaerolineales bacterium]